jgi:hypothetical protein
MFPSHVYCHGFYRLLPTATPAGYPTAINFTYYTYWLSFAGFHDITVLRVNEVSLHAYCYANRSLIPSHRFTQVISFINSILRFTATLHCHIPLAMLTATFHCHHTYYPGGHSWPPRLPPLPVATPTLSAPARSVNTLTPDQSNSCQDLVSHFVPLPAAFASDNPPFLNSEDATLPRYCMMFHPFVESPQVALTN